MSDELSPAQRRRLREMADPNSDNSTDTDYTQESSSSNSSSISQDSIRFNPGPSIRHNPESAESPELQSPKSLKATMGDSKWKLNANDENCGICRTSFDSCCMECREPGTDCPLALGVCKHAFHLHCIQKWIEVQRDEIEVPCPLCRQEWEFAK